MKQLLKALLLLLLMQVPLFGKAQMSRASQEFAKKGIELQAWMGVDASPGIPDVASTMSVNRTGRYIRVQLPFTEYLSIAEIQVFSNGVNVALGKNATQSSTESSGVASRAVDGNTSGIWANSSITHTGLEQEAWLQVDLGQSYTISSIIVWNRTEDGLGHRLRGFYLFVSDTLFTDATLYNTYTQSGVSHYYKGSARQYPINTEWSNTNMTSATFYEEPGFNFTFMQQPTVNWSLAKAPYMAGLKARFPGEIDILQRSPNSEELSKGYLNSMQRSALNRLTTVCFGDEENYGSDIVSWLKDWYALSHSKYPNVLVHNNQYGGQWTEANLRTYMQTAQPDLLTYDLYYYSPGNTIGSPGGSLRRIFNDLHSYRKVALEGYDGNGTSPLAYGLYLPGFRLTDNEVLPGYTVSESQIYGFAYAGAVMGAKWFNIFRYEADPSYYFFRDGNGGFQPQYWQYVALFKELRNLSPHLSRLISTDVRVIQGQNSNGTNAKPNNMNIWDSNAGPYITGISAVNLVAGTNNGLKGDVIIGYFRPVHGLDYTPGVSMGPIPNISQRYFMLMNGLTKPNGCCSALGSAGIQQDTVQGKGVYAQQAITLTINFGSNPVDTLYKIRKDNGQAEIVTLTPTSGGNYTYTDNLYGGSADLFYWKNAHSSPQAIVRLYGDCNYGSWTTGILSTGDYTQGQLESLGFYNDEISSLKVAPGYQAILYSNNNFAGSSLTITGDNACLIDNGFNDIVSSIKVRPTGTLMAKAVEQFDTEREEENVYPNPLQGEVVYVNLQLEKESKVRFTLYDNSGRIVRTSVQQLPKGKNKTSFNTGRIPPGIYILKMSGGGKLRNSYRIVKLT
ncbi:discoidin domain-containing protein [Chitinophaga sp. SYP-B3965]|uniref:galactose-binding domain-containing protein n=1 Tax=Chitinophaga sp. SYP-B3965 TaxID=2663120 RepID=UPI0015668B75|nr:discoidin domain-containing protein [Chitinophaga sp. SYP-B3965]